jgi:hypothetical protein
MDGCMDGWMNGCSGLRLVLRRVSVWQQAFFFQFCDTKKKIIKNFFFGGKFSTKKKKEKEKCECPT